MQKIKALIEKLNNQFEHKAPPAEMLATLQLLQRELAGGLKETQVLGSSNVSVMVPNMPSINYAKTVEQVIDDEKVYFELPAADASDEEIDELILENNRIEAQKNTVNKPEVAPAEKESVGKKRSNQTEMIFNEGDGFIDEVPTFSQYSKPEKEDKPVSAEAKTESPVKQLKKAISELDRQIFLKDLFRGDEVMYERSIKTIDNFHAYPEAELWIRRELKLKLAWLTDNPTVDHFERLVKRRFA